MIEIACVISIIQIACQNDQIQKESYKSIVKTLSTTGIIFYLLILDVTNKILTVGKRIAIISIVLLISGLAIM